MAHYYHTTIPDLFGEHPPIRTPEPLRTEALAAVDVFEQLAARGNERASRWLGALLIAFALLESTDGRMAQFRSRLVTWLHKQGFVGPPPVQHVLHMMRGYGNELAEALDCSMGELIAAYEALGDEASSVERRRAVAAAIMAAPAGAAEA